MTASGIPGEVAQVETMDAVIAGVRRFHQSGRTDSSIWTAAVMLVLVFCGIYVFSGSFLDKSVLKFQWSGSQNCENIHVKQKWRDEMA